MSTPDDHGCASPTKPHSIVPSMADVTIDTRCPAPQSNMNSLNFDRVVNAYSIMHVKRRLVNHHNEEHRKNQSKETKNNTNANANQRRESEKIESWIQSYREFKSKQQQHQQGGHHGGVLLHTPNGRAYVRWALTIMVGLICGGVACLLVFCTEHLVEFRTQHLNWQLQLISGRVTMDDFKSIHNGTWWLPHAPGMTLARTYGVKAVFAQYIIFNACVACISAALCILFAPNAVGSGIPEVKAYLNGVSVQSFADVSVFLVKIVATIFSVSSGLIVGPEGPLVHIGAIVGQGITKTTRWEMMLRKFQIQRPRIARLAGCGRADNGTFVDEVKEDKLINELLHVGRLSDLIEGDNEDGSVSEESRLLSMRSYGSTAEESFNLAASQQSKRAALDNSREPGANFTFFTEVMALVSRFRNDCDRRDLISIGVATGFAAAFGAPVGGLLYSFEEASSFFTIPLMWRTLVATAIGTFVIAIYHGDLSRFSVLSLGDELQSDNAHAVNSFAELPFYVLIGAAGGLLGAFFNGCYLYLNTARKSFYGSTTLNTGYCRLIEVLLVSIMTGCMTFGLSVLLPTSWACANIIEGIGEDVPAADFNQIFNCPDGQFNEIASILLGSRDAALNDILTDPNKFQPYTLLLCGIVFLFLMVITFGIFIPSGLFMPTLLTGSSLFGWAGLVIQRHILPSIVPAHMAMVGATAMLAGIQRTTVSLCVIMMEATGQTQVLIPLIISVVVARYVGDLFNEGFYHINIHMKGYPFLEHEIKESFDICTVSDVMSAPVIALRGVEEAQNIESVLWNSVVQSFPVLDQDTNQYVGLISRDQLVALLECGLYLEVLEGEEARRRESVRVKTVMDRATTHTFDHVLLSDADTYSSNRKTAKLIGAQEWLNENVIRNTDDGSIILLQGETLPGGKSIPRSGDTVVDVNVQGTLAIRLAEDEKQMHVDVAAAMNRGAYSITQNCPLSKAYNLFTSLGLRHLPVLGKDGSVVGILTRSNFNADYIERRTGLRMHH